ncbi:hypothetical protein GXW74_04230 [Roseomonas eburnea]|uniref:Uncharacterized protein n=1 Tax=Neoroseomonas eburnea TaxID=1346889 RepID=A0A9X9X7J4_9PROT|nr:hypothetical protein [Neoroseomonas eburnea]MBR0679680.1 hypothetical protein [Neoroseomonas eburnea]
MPAIKRAKTSFAAGELAPELLGRGDLRAFENGARRLRNVFIQPTGGVTRRPGLRHVTPLPGPARLIPFEFNTEQTYLMVLTHGTLQVFLGDAVIATLAGPWSTAMLPQIGFTQNADTLLLVHPDMQPQRVTRTPSGWTIAPWAFLNEPFFRFADPALAMTASGTAGVVTLQASSDFFHPNHVGVRLRVADRRVLVTSVTSAILATATVQEELTTTGPTTDWDEAAFGMARGWPATCCFHQDRLVIGGSRDLPNRLWLSRTGDLFNFDAGTGLDDEAIEFGLVSDQVNAIRGLFSGRHLQVFTSGAEWMVSGDPLTPASIQLNRQTRVGSPVDRLIPPVDVDGSTVFVGRGQGVHEFAYTDVSDTYQANDLAVLARHLVKAPVSMAYDQGMRLLHMVMADGSLGTLTLYRAEQVTAWTRQETEGAFRAVAESEGVVWAVTERYGVFGLERFEAGLALDAALTGATAMPQDEWSGLAHLEGRTVGVLADGAPRAATSVVGGAVTIDPPAAQVQIGLAFRHEIEPLPPDLISASGAATGPLRLVAVTFRLLETAALSVDFGRGAEPVPFRRLDTALLDAPPAPFTGDVRLRGLGWRRDRLKPVWRIEGDAPLPMTLLSVTSEIRMTD